MGHRSNTLYAEKIASLPTPPQRWPLWIVSGGGLGLLRPAPGSWGTAGPATAYWLALCLGAHHHLAWLGGASLLLALIFSVLLVRFGYWACCYYRKVDPGQVVLDEFAGFFITVAFVPVPAWFVTHGTWGLWLFVAIVFLIFRATDTLKIPPARQLEALPWGWGILLDDIAAGIQANILAQVLMRFL